MHTNIGPYLLLNQTRANSWCHFDISDTSVSYYEWTESGWSKQPPVQTSKILYAACPQERIYLAVVLTKEQQLLKIHLPKQETAALPKITTALRPIFIEEEMHWLPHWHPQYLLGGNFYNIDFLSFPSHIETVLTTDVLSSMPALPASLSNTIQPNEVIVDVTQAFLRCRGMEFPVSRYLSDAQKSFIVQFISNNGDWPFSGNNRQEQIELGLNLLRYTPDKTSDTLPIRQYRDPVFLANLLTDSFYPSNKEDKGYYATVAHVWRFVNVLLAHGVRLLGYGGTITLPYPPKGYGVSSTQYIEKHAPHSNKRKKTGLSLAEKKVHHIVMEYVELGELPNLDEYTNYEQTHIIAILEQLISRRAITLELSTSLFNSIANLLSLDDESAGNFLQLTCKIVLAAISITQANALILQLNDLDEDTESTALIEKLTPLMSNIEENADYENLLNTLSPAHQALLRVSLEKSKLPLTPTPGSTSIFLMNTGQSSTTYHSAVSTGQQAHQEFQA